MPIEKLPPARADSGKLPPALLSAAALRAAPGRRLGLWQPDFLQAHYLTPNHLQPPPVARHRRQAAVARQSSDRMVRLVPTAAQVRQGTVVACAHGR